MNRLVSRLLVTMVAFIISYLGESSLSEVTKSRVLENLDSINVVSSNNITQSPGRPSLSSKKNRLKGFERNISHVRNKRRKDGGVVSSLNETFISITDHYVSYDPKNISYDPNNATRVDPLNTTTLNGMSSYYSSVLESAMATPSNPLAAKHPANPYKLEASNHNSSVVSVMGAAKKKKNGSGSYSSASIKALQRSRGVQLNEWSNYKRKCKDYDSSDAKSLYYIHTSEGILSHLVQAENLWNIASYYNRTIILSSSTASVHFKGNPWHIWLCDIFDFPVNIKCSCTPNLHFAKTMKGCKIYRFYDRDLWAQDTKIYILPKGTPNVDLRELSSDLKCLAGYIDQWSDAYKRSKRISFPPYVYSFKKRYLALLPDIRAVLGVGDDYNFLAVHWRRGDQLQTRCRTGSDRSVNCGSVHAFKYTVSTNTWRLYPDRKKPPVVFVCTNEANAENIKAITKKNYRGEGGFSTFASALSKPLRVERNLTITLLDEYIIELMMMCYAKYVMCIGTSKVHWFIRKCRQGRKETRDPKSIIEIA